MKEPINHENRVKGLEHTIPFTTNSKYNFQLSFINTVKTRRTKKGVV